MWFKNLKIYRLVADWTVSAEELQAMLARHAYQPNNELQTQNLGWVPVRESGSLVHAVGGQWLLAARAEKKLLPASVINQFARAQAQEIEAQQGYKPGRKQMKEIKERVTEELLPRAFSLWRDTYVWIDPVNRWLVIDAAATAKADEILSLLSKSVSPFPAEPLYTAQSPVAAMTAWLAAGEAPANFTIDQDTELRAADDSRAAVRYVKHSIATDDVARHIADGKQCVRLALTWADRVSLTLTDSLVLKRITALDVLREGDTGMAANDDERFDTDMALMTGELARLLEDLLAALGGEKQI